MGRLHELTRNECLRLLGSTTVGHVSITCDGLPVILPVSYRVGRGVIDILRPERALERAASPGGIVVAFEADHLEPQVSAGWSVLVRGVLRRGRARSEADAAASSRSRGKGAGAGPPSAGEPVLTLDPTLVTGRSLGDEVLWPTDAAASVSPRRHA